MSELILKHWAGFIQPENDSGLVWQENAIKALKEDCDLLVFKVPKDRMGLTNPNIIKDIEELLQKNYPL